MSVADATDVSSNISKKKFLLHSWEGRELSGYSKSHLPHLNTLMKALATFDQLLSAFDVRIIDWISNWADTMASPDLTANAAFALQMQSVMNIMHSNAQPFSIYKSSVTSMYHLNHNSST